MLRIKFKDGMPVLIQARASAHHHRQAKEPRVRRAFQQATKEGGVPGLPLHMRRHLSAWSALPALLVCVEVLQRGDVPQGSSE